MLVWNCFGAKTIFPISSVTRRVILCRVGVNLVSFVSAAWPVAGRFSPPLVNMKTRGELGLGFGSADRGSCLFEASVLITTELLASVCKMAQVECTLWSEMLFLDILSEKFCTLFIPSKYLRNKHFWDE